MIILREQFLCRSWVGRIDDRHGEDWQEAITYCRSGGGRLTIDMEWIDRRQSCGGDSSTIGMGVSTVNMLIADPLHVKGRSPP